MWSYRRTTRITLASRNPTWITRKNSDARIVEGLTFNTIVVLYGNCVQLQRQHHEASEISTDITVPSKSLLLMAQPSPPSKPSPLLSKNAVVENLRRVYASRGEIAEYSDVAPLVGDEVTGDCAVSLPSRTTCDIPVETSQNNTNKAVLSCFELRHQGVNWSQAVIRATGHHPLESH